MTYGPAALDRDQLHQLRTLHAARRNAGELLAITTPQSDSWWRAWQLLMDCQDAVKRFWRDVPCRARQG